MNNHEKEKLAIVRRLEDKPPDYKDGYLAGYNDALDYATNVLHLNFPTPEETKHE